jgi:hypothetical protein
MNARWIIPFVILGGALASYALAGGRRRKVVVGGRRFAPREIPN